MAILEEISACLVNLRQKKPLVHHITNYVTVNDCANITLAIGASPVMADDIHEVEEMVAYAAALVLNIGTLNSRSIASMLAAGKKAREKGIPVVFDPVGVGATTLRTATARQIITEIGPAVIRGNMSEIKLIAGLKAAIKGVDSVADEADGQQVARRLSRELGCIIAITGKQDIIAREDQVYVVDNGHALLSQVTGTGCMATSLIACYCAAADDWFTGTVGGVMTMGLAGELAQQALTPQEGIGTFRMRLFDAVSQLTPDIIRKGGRVSHG